MKICAMRRATERRLPRSYFAPPWLTQGYFNDPDAAEKLWAGCYLHTNDIAVMTPKCYVHVTDRMKDVIKTGGEWISSLQIEDFISRCQGVKEAAVIGIKDEKWGEAPMALVVRDAEGTKEVTDLDIKAHLTTIADRGIISKYGIPDKILFVEQPAGTSVGIAF
jgi:fatty-acyl-CoA synthase